MKMNAIQKRLKALESAKSEQEHDGIDLSHLSVPELKILEHWLESNQSFELPVDLQEKLER